MPELKPRRSDEAPSYRLVDELNREFWDRIANGRHFLLVLSTPLNDARKAKEATRRLLLEMLKLPIKPAIDLEVESFGDRIQATLFTHGNRAGDKIVTAFGNCKVDFDVFETTKVMLEHRIADNALKCAKSLAAGPV